MSAPLRLLDTGLASPRHNVALTAALAELHRAGQAPDTVRLSLYSPSILIDRDQHRADAVHLRACRRNRVDVVRRLTDGGSFYLDRGVIAWEVIADPTGFGRGPGEIANRICSGVAAGLARFGLTARFRPPGDIVIDGRRICQSGGSLDGTTVVFQGTVLVDSNVARSTAFLRLPAGDEGAGARLLARTTNLAEWLGRVPSIDEVKGVLLAGMAHHWRRELHPDVPTQHELVLAARLLADGMGIDGPTGRSAPSGRSRSTAETASPP
jgi:lipoate-protein ligase A